MRFKVVLEWVRNEHDEVVGLVGRMAREDGLELCTIELDEDTSLMSEPCIKDDLKHRMSERLYEFAYEHIDD